VITTYNQDGSVNYEIKDIKEGSARPISSIYEENNSSEGGSYYVKGQ
jgi:hypothetical protein